MGQKNPCKKSCCSRRDHLEKSAKRQKHSDQIAYDQSIYKDDFDDPEITKKVEKHDLPESVTYRPQRHANEIASLTISNFNKEEFEALYLKTTQFEYLCEKYGMKMYGMKCGCASDNF